MCNKTKKVWSEPVIEELSIDDLFILFDDKCKELDILVENDEHSNSIHNQTMKIIGIQTLITKGLMKQQIDMQDKLDVVNNQIVKLNQLKVRGISTKCVCSLCGEEMETRKFKDVIYWSCPCCPAILFEYVDINDARKVAEHIESK